jgi:hypothetical protein
MSEETSFPLLVIKTLFYTFGCAFFLAGLLYFVRHL